MGRQVHDAIIVQLSRGEGFWHGIEIQGTLRFVWTNHSGLRGGFAKPGEREACEFRGPVLGLDRLSWGSGRVHLPHRTRGRHNREPMGGGSEIN